MLIYTIAIVPLAIYLLLIGGLHLRKRPLVTSGWRDTLTLGIACVGLAMVGPMQLFFPMQASAIIPNLSWAMMLALYFLLLTLFLLWSKPRLTVYGMTSEQFRESLQKAAAAVDSTSNWNGDVLSMPQADLQLVVEPTVSSSVHSVAAIGKISELSPWRHLESELVKVGSESIARPTAAAWIMIGIATILLTISLMPVVLHPETAYLELKSFLWR